MTIPATTPKPKIIDPTMPIINPGEYRLIAALLACVYDAKASMSALPALPAYDIDTCITPALDLLLTMSIAQAPFERETLHFSSTFIQPCSRGR
jgi:hypothetical protein